ncbi:MAG: EamA family transporter [Spirochaetia bacterium]|nr:EamA family transporter [Spirochaetia bacterium]
MSLSTIIVFVLGLVLNALASILIKASARDEVEASLTGVIKGVLLNPILLGGLASFGLAFFAYRYVLGHMKLSVAYPIFTSCGFIIVLIASRYFFDEQLNWVQWGGIGLVLGGIWMIASQI